MRKIQKLVDNIEEELNDAQKYAECYVEAKAADKTTLANRYHTMSEEELKHASYLHEQAVEEIEIIRKVFKPTAEMQDKWDEAHKDYVAHAALIRQMLSM